VDWYAIVDRTRFLRSNSHWETIAGILESAEHSFAVDKWDNQPYRVECFPPDELVITAEGIVSIAVIGEGDDDVLSHAGQFKKVQKIFKRPYSGWLTYIKAVGLMPIRCTPEHPILVRQHDTLLKYNGAERRFHPDNFVPAKELKQFDLVMVPRIKGIVDIETVCMNGGPKSKHLGEVELDLDLCAVIGIYLAEGAIRLDQRTTQFTMHKDEIEQSDLLKRWAHGVGLSTHEVVVNGSRTVYIFGKALSGWLKAEFGSGAFDKRLPGWFLLLPFDKQLKTLEYYFLGDGTFNTGQSSNVEASSRSEALTRMIQLILIRNGYGAALSVGDDHGLPRYRLSISGVYGEHLANLWGKILPTKKRRYNHIRIDDNYAYFPIKDVSWGKYDGDVFNLEVEEDHTYCAPCVVHNCMVEKDALVGVIARACQPLDVPYFACRGYSSDSEMWRAAQRFLRYEDNGQIPYIIHLGDHDPSGIDMTRDIEDRLNLFNARPYVKRIALNYDQVEMYNPPPNPAKETDSRWEGYVAEYNTYSSWELDALDPNVIVDLITGEILALRDDDRWDERMIEETEGKLELRRMRQEYENGHR